jgi:anti-anti-sigma regulatory factor
MLRIYIHDEVPVTSFVLEGKLVGPWVEELEKGWESALAANPSRMMLVDLADVSFIDSEGRALLARMRQKGARLLSTGVLINAIVDEIDAQQRKHSAQCGSFNHESEKSQAYQSRDVNTEGTSNG